MSRKWVKLGAVIMAASILIGCATYASYGKRITYDDGKRVITIESDSTIATGKK